MLSTTALFPLQVHAVPEAVEYQEALSMPVPQARPDDQILRCCLQQQDRMRQARFIAPQVCRALSALPVLGAWMVRDVTEFRELVES